MYDKIKNEAANAAHQAKEMIAQQAKKAAKETAKQIGSQIWSVLAPCIPYILIALLVVLIIVAFVDWNDVGISAAGTNSASTSSWEQFINWLHLKEGGGTIYKNSEGKDCYQVISDGSATGSAVGYGVDIPTHGAEIRAAGYDTSIGSLIPVDVVDAIEKREIEEYYTAVKDIIAANGIELTEYQLFALTSRAYNCGIAGGMTYTRGQKNLNFSDSYKEYWNQSEDDSYGVGTTGDIEHSLYREFMSQPTTSGGNFLLGLQNRRISEWTLFQTGYYDSLGEYWKETMISSDLYNDDGTVNEEKIEELQLAIENEYNLVTASSAGNNIGGQYNKESCEKVTGEYLGFSYWSGSYPISNLGGIIYQCPWWANGRASQYYGKQIKISGNAVNMYENAQSLGYKVGAKPKVGSLAVYYGPDSYGHVAFVEAVDEINRCYYISHSGSGKSWFGIQKVNGLDGAPWSSSGYSLKGFIYLE